uniref:Uncharacterized protein n=1 Tax=Mycena chlorophos TaxID=658473 RepID=A0ABQ0L7C6_MYCCL|nr:predicted protein [Mycena chlorophos]
MPSGTHRTVHPSRHTVSQARNSENERRHLLKRAVGLEALGRDGRRLSVSELSQGKRRSTPFGGCERERRGPDPSRSYRLGTTQLIQATRHATGLPFPRCASRPESAS